MGIISEIHNLFAQVVDESKSSAWEWIGPNQELVEKSAKKVFILEHGILYEEVFYYFPTKFDYALLFKFFSEN